jgi:cellulose synthase/poly-beta-1,6-N-acetylglucosamine synthase-like glycosyltransferase
MINSYLPKVSVIVPIYNGENDLPELIQCLRSQTYPVAQVEYLLVDNYSCDRTSTILQSEATIPGLSIVPLLETNIQSSYAARNTGIRAATGEIIVFTDVDCRPEPNWLSEIVPGFINPKLGIAVGEIIAFPGQTLWEKYADRQNTLSQKHTLAHPFYPYGQTANLAIRRQVFLEVGLFRPYLTTGGDADICWRIQQQTNWQLEFFPSAIVRHRHRSTLPEFQSQWRRYGKSNRYLHELYGVDLMRELPTSEYLYLLARWLGKELPINLIKAIARQVPSIDLFSTPVSLLAAAARAAGQRQAQLPPLARQIDWLSPPEEGEALRSLPN